MPMALVVQAEADTGSARRRMMPLLTPLLRAGINDAKLLPAKGTAGFAHFSKTTRSAASLHRRRKSPHPPMVFVRMAISLVAPGKREVTISSANRTNRRDLIVTQIAPEKIINQPARPGLFQIGGRSCHREHGGICANQLGRPARGPLGTGVITIAPKMKCTPAGLAVWTPQSGPSQRRPCFDFPRRLLAVIVWLTVDMLPAILVVRDRRKACCLAKPKQQHLRDQFEVTSGNLDFICPAPPAHRPKTVDELAPALIGKYIRPRDRHNRRNRGWPSRRSEKSLHCRADVLEFFPAADFAAGEVVGLRPGRTSQTTASSTSSEPLFAGSGVTRVRRRVRQPPIASMELTGDNLLSESLLCKEICSLYADEISESILYALEEGDRSDGHVGHPRRQMAPG